MLPGTNHLRAPVPALRLQGDRRCCTVMQASYHLAARFGLIAILFRRPVLTSRWALKMLSGSLTDSGCDILSTVDMTFSRSAEIEP